MTKFQEFIKEYGHNDFIICQAFADEKLKEILKRFPNSLLIVPHFPGFTDERMFFGKLISDNFDEITTYFGQENLYNNDHINCRVGTSPIRGDNW
jgi:hypothetical protein